MKKSLMLVFSIIALGVSAIAGDGGKWSGRIVYAMEYDLPEALESQRAFLATEMTTYIGKGFTRTEQTTGMGDQISIANLKSGVTTVLMNMMGQKIAISTEDLDIEGAAEPKIEISDETKEVAGYMCKKATYSIEKGEEMVSFEVYYTEDLPADANTQFAGLGGYPMEYVIESQGMVITYTAKEVVEEKVSSKLGEVPSDYEKMSYEEFMQMMGGGQ